MCNCSSIELILAYNKKTKVPFLLLHIASLLWTSYTIYCLRIYRFCSFTFHLHRNKKHIADDTLVVIISFQNIQRKKKDRLNITLCTTDEIYEIDDIAVCIHFNRAIEFPIAWIAIRHSLYLLHLTLFFFFSQHINKRQDKSIKNDREFQALSKSIIAYQFFFHSDNNLNNETTKL
jgi:hypothetical protein